MRTFFWSSQHKFYNFRYWSLYTTKNNVYVLSPHVQEILDSLEEYYVEFSPSKTGLHVFIMTNWYSNLRSTLPPSVQFPNITLEIFRKNKYRAVTVTGEQWPDSFKRKMPLFEKDICTKSLQTNYFKSILKQSIAKSTIQLWDDLKLTPNGEKQALDILEKVKSSALFGIYLGILREKGFKSSSEYDFQLCTFLYKFMSVGTPENLVEMVKFLLIRLRYRKKFSENPTYVQRTAQNAYYCVEEQGTLGPT
uniref:Uncharacterized protein n=1 Tax=Palmaria palmata TaxID=2822 RepID=A0A0A7A7W5_PALPL|nr:hypothetical protein Palm.palm.mt.43 [Palmaria palmata]AHB62169.1 hypothetical protein Palm.palm.mt.43 [Palmaria palmata]